MASRALDAKASGISYAQHHTGRALLTPDEVRTMPADREFRGLFDPA